MADHPADERDIRILRHHSLHHGRVHFLHGLHHRFLMLGHFARLHAAWHLHVATHRRCRFACVRHRHLSRRRFGRYEKDGCPGDYELKQAVHCTLHVRKDVCFRSEECWSWAADEAPGRAGKP
ncbi:hypothetical protein D9M68_938030 [compost metagenome]